MCTPEFPIGNGSGGSNREQKKKTASHRLEARSVHDAGLPLRIGAIAGQQVSGWGVTSIRLTQLERQQEQTKSGF
jgi:hypothetical protein